MSQLEHLGQLWHLGLQQSSHSGFMRIELLTSSATARHANPNHLARRVFHCGYNIFLVKTPNVQVARYKLLHGAFVRKYVLPLSKSPVAMKPCKVQFFFFITGVRCGFRASLRDICPNSLLRRLLAVASGNFPISSVGRALGHSNWGFMVRISFSGGWFIC